jgi:hypothetical protein
MISVNTISTYIGIVLLSFLATSVWVGLSSPGSGRVTQRLRSCLPVTVQVTICSLGYSVFFFVLTLAIGIAVWLVLLGLVYLPADILTNAFGKQWTEHVVSSILPYVSRSSHSPGLFHQPILDYSTLCVLFLAPAAGIWSTVASKKRRENKAKTEAANNTGETSEIKKNAA